MSRYINRSVCFVSSSSEAEAKEIGAAGAERKKKRRRPHFMERFEKVAKLVYLSSSDEEHNDKSSTGKVVDDKKNKVSKEASQKATVKGLLHLLHFECKINL